MIDLGAWASESYRIPVAQNKDDIESGRSDSEDGI